MTNHDNKVYLQHIIDSIKQIDNYVGKVSFDDFASNQMMIDAVIRNFEVMGEACNRLPDDFKEKYSRINFQPATSMRNRLIHGYEDINLNYVWEAIKQDLPKLFREIENIIND